jgi:hypothetical protein
MEDKLLAAIVQLSNKERAYELIKAVRLASPKKDMGWVLQKVLYDLRRPITPPPNPKLTNQLSTSTAELAALLQKRKPSQPAITAPVDIHRASAVTKAELYRLASSQAVAHRLVEALALRNPDRAAQWCWEKAISDLERDRSAR